MLSRRKLIHSLLPASLLLASAAFAVEPLGDAGLTDVAGAEGIRTESRPGVSAGPQAGHATQREKERSASERLGTLADQIESSRSQSVALGSQLRDTGSVDPATLLPPNTGKIAYPKNMNTSSVKQPEVTQPLGVFRQSNVQIDGGMRLGGVR